jgi:hypothetical protein
MSATNANDRPKRIAATLGALGLLALAALLWYQRDGKAPGAAPVTATSASVATTAPLPGSAGGATASPSLSTTRAAAPIGSASASVAALGGAAQIREALEQYQAFSQFPPWSRPADGSQTHLWKWNSLDATGQAFGNDGKGKKISGELLLDKMFAGPGETITATVTVWRGGYEDSTREPMDANVTGTIEVWQSAKPIPGGSSPPPPTPGAPPAPGSEGFFPVATVSFSNLAGGPGRRYVATFTPSTIEALKTQVEARFVATVDPDGHPFPFAETFRYAASAPLVVLEQHSDAIVKGSLEVTVAVDVKRLGPVMVQATLFDAAGTNAIATYDDYYRPTQLGPQALKLTFFGKAIGDKRVDGPYSVRALHGFVRVSDADPPEVFWESKATFATGSYKATDFSNREWDSPEKTEKINQYKRMLGSFESK